MASNYTVKFIEDAIDKYYKQEVRKVQQESNFQLVFTDDKVYNMDEIVLTRRRDVGNTASTLHVIDKEEDKYLDTVLIFLAIDHLLFNTDENHKYVYEGTSYTRLTKPVVGINNIITYIPYDSILDVPNHVAIIQSTLDPEINKDLMDYLYNQIPVQLRERDG